MMQGLNFTSAWSHLTFEYCKNLSIFYWFGIFNKFSIELNQEVEKLHYLFESIGAINQKSLSLILTPDAATH